MESAAAEGLPAPGKCPGIVREHVPEYVTSTSTTNPASANNASALTPPPGRRSAVANPAAGRRIRRVEDFIRFPFRIRV